MMRSFIYTLIVTLGIVPAAYAAPCYGTKMPPQFRFFAGAQTHAVINRYLENDKGALRSTQYFMLVSFGVTDWLSLDLKGGAGNIKQRPAWSDEIDYDATFAGGYGVRLRLYDGGKAKAVIGFQHISVHPHKNIINGVGDEAILDDWQLSLLGSYACGRLTPYLGAKVSRTDYIHRVDDHRKRVMSDLTRSVGVVAGCDIHLTNKTWINLEGQFIDVIAAAVSLNVAF